MDYKERSKRNADRNAFANESLHLQAGLSKLEFLAGLIWAAKAADLKVELNHKAAAESIYLARIFFDALEADRDYQDARPDGVSK